MRTLRAALELFAENGVGATSYQMIADAVGVTKGPAHLKNQCLDKSVDLAQTRFELNLTKSKLAGDCVDEISFDVEMHRFERIAQLNIKALTAGP